MKVRFTKDYVVKGSKPVYHCKDDELVCNQNSAKHFITRGVAVLIEEEPEVKVVPVEVEKKSAAETTGALLPDPASPEKTVSKRRGRPPKSSQ